MLSTTVTAEMVTGVLDEVLGLVPIVLPVAISFIAFRKAWGFLMGALHSA